MSKRSFRTALAVVSATVVIAGIVVAYLVNEALSYPDHRHRGTGAEVEVEVTSGMNFQAIADLLEERGVIDKPRWFRLYAMHKGVANQVKTGRYVLADNLTPREALEALYRLKKQAKEKS